MIPLSAWPHLWMFPDQQPVQLLPKQTLKAAHFENRCCVFFCRFWPWDRMCKHAFAGQNTQQIESESRHELRHVDRQQKKKCHVKLMESKLMKFSIKDYLSVNVFSLFTILSDWQQRFPHEGTKISFLVKWKHYSCHNIRESLDWHWSKISDNLNCNIII